MTAWNSCERFLVLVQNTNEVDDSMRHDIPRHRVEKVRCTCFRVLLSLNAGSFQLSCMSIKSE
jgi:hypothetical protein